MLYHRLTRMLLPICLTLILENHTLYKVVWITYDVINQFVIQCKKCVFFEEASFLSTIVSLPFSAGNSTFHIVIHPRSIDFSGNTSLYRVFDIAKIKSGLRNQNFKMGDVSRRRWLVNRKCAYRSLTGNLLRQSL